MSSYLTTQELQGTYPQELLSRNRASIGVGDPPTRYTTNAMSRFVPTGFCRLISQANSIQE